MTSLLDLLTYAEHGAAVALLDLERNAPQKKAATLGDQHRGHVCDVTQREACQRVAEQVIKDFGASTFSSITQESLLRTNVECFGRLTKTSMLGCDNRPS